MNDKEKIDAYIRKHDKWTAQLEKLRKVLQTSELIEEVKWGVPSYTLDNKILISIAGFKNHCAVWFHQGVFLKDSVSALVNAQEGTTKGMRQLRIGPGDKVDEKLLRSYVIETIANHRAGRKIAPNKKSLNISSELASALKQDKKLNTAFRSLTPGKQREYADHIASAKQAAARLSRIEKAAPLILQGVGLHDKYKNC